MKKTTNIKYLIVCSIISTICIILGIVFLSVNYEWEKYWIIFTVLVVLGIIGIGSLAIPDKYFMEKPKAKEDLTEEDLKRIKKNRGIYASIICSLVTVLIPIITMFGFFE